MNISTIWDQFVQENTGATNPGHSEKKGIRNAMLNSLRRTSLAVLMATIPVVMLSGTTPSAFGQASSSSDAAGKVVDSTGASIPGATVHLVNTGTGAERTATTNNDGSWSIPNIPPANYRIRVEKTGFKTAQIAYLTYDRQPDPEVFQDVHGEKT